MIESRTSLLSPYFSRGSSANQFTLFCFSKSNSSLLDLLLTHSRSLAIYCVMVSNMCSIVTFKLAYFSSGVLPTVFMFFMEGIFKIFNSVRFFSYECVRIYTTHISVAKFGNVVLISLLPSKKSHIYSFGLVAVMKYASSFLNISNLAICTSSNSNISLDLKNTCSTFEI